MALPGCAPKRFLLFVVAAVHANAAVDLTAALFGSYRPGGWSAHTQTWRDASGNGRHAFTTAVQNSSVFALVQSFTAPAGQRGAALSVKYVAGSKGAALTFGTDPIPANFTICSVTRIPEAVGDDAALPAGARGAAATGNRVLASTASLWVHGHDRGLAGVAFYNQAAYKTGGDGLSGGVWSWANTDNWLWMCAANEGSPTDPDSQCTLYIQGSMQVKGETVCQLGGGSAAGVLAINAQGASTDSRHAPGMWAVAEVAMWARWLNAAELSSVLLDMQQRYGFEAKVAAAPTLPGPPAPAKLAVVNLEQSNSAFVSVLAIGIASFATVVLLLVNSTLGQAIKRRRTRAAARASILQRFTYDIFLSYRRVDFAVVDVIADKLNIEALRVFVDRGGSMAGRPFDRELLCAIEATACFTPVITLHAMTVLANTTATQLDFTLVEYLVALHFSLTGKLKLIYPIMVGEETHDVNTRPYWDALWQNSAFKAACNALPDTIPTTSLEFTDSVLRAEFGPSAALHSALRNATIRQIMFARNDNDGFTGLLRHDACSLTGLQEDADLYIRHRYAANIKPFLQQVRGCKGASL
jgi:hypothetical protein